MAYGDRWFPAAEYEGMQVPEAYPHDPEILPHQHENLEELFPNAYVPYPADADELASEPAPLEIKGGYLARGEEAPQTQPPQGRWSCGLRGGL